MTDRSDTVNRGKAPRERDVMVTGMGFCMPGNGQPVCTPDELWDIASHGRSCLTDDDVYYSKVNLTDEEFATRLPDIPGVFSQHFTAAHRFGLISLAEACQDARLDFREGALAEAAILAGRGSVDANVESYVAASRADPETISARDALELFVRTEQAATPSDVALVQGALTRSTGPCYTVSCGCASSAAQIGNARLMIASGAVDTAVVTGVDTLSVELVRNAQRLLGAAQRAGATARDAGVPDDLPSFDGPMRPYDRRAECVNYGEGSATLILESREHAERRGGRAYGQVLSDAMARDGLAHPLASDESGAGLVRAVEQCLTDRWDVTEVPYIHGGSDGDPVVTAFEANAVRQLYGSAAAGLLMTSQEACFGHNGAPAGNLGVALTLLMMRQQEVCPTANCEEPAEGIPFDPVPGARTRPLAFDHALSFTYQIGGVKSCILLASPDAH